MTEDIINDDKNYENITKDIKIFSNTDEKLKFLGKILNNDSSRNILLSLIEKEMTANEVATQMNISLPLTLNHIHQMIDAGIVVVCKTTSNSKNQPMKHYSAKPAIVILPEKVMNKANNSKSLFRSLRGIMKFSVIGFVGVVSWITIKPNYQGLPIEESNNEITDIVPSLPLDRIVTPNPGITTNIDSMESLVISLIIPVVVVITGIILDRTLTKWFNKRSKKRVKIR